MSYYSKVSSRFWTGETGRAIRGDAAAQVVAAYLMTSPHANMLGFYYLPVSYIATDTGIPLEGASKALQRLCDGQFCGYDYQSEVVWVFNMAERQIGESLEPKDKRVISIGREYESIPNNTFLQAFFDKYGKPYHLQAAREYRAPSQGACQAPSKPIAVAVTVAPSATAATAASATAPSSAVAARGGANGTGRTVDTWQAYAAAYQHRWSVQPTRNRRVNAQLAKFLEAVPIEDAPDIAAFYVRSNRGLYVSAKHPVNLLLRDAEALRTEWLTGRHGTEAEARQVDKTAATLGQVDRLLAETNQ